MVIYFEIDFFLLEFDFFLLEMFLFVFKLLLIYVYGGGFLGGDWAGGYKLCVYFLEKGIVVVMIIYIFYMKDKSFSCDGIFLEKI